MAQAISNTELVAALGAYNRDNPGRFGHQVFNKLQTIDHVTVVECNDELPLITFSGSGDLIRPQLYDNAWNPPADAIKMPTRILKVRPGKSDLELIPATLWKTWLGKNKKAGSSNQHFLPFEEFFMDHLAMRYADEIQRLIIWKGSYNSAGTTPGATADGFEKIIEDSITAAGTFDVPAGQVTDMGVISGSNAYDQTIAVARKLPEALRERQTKAFMPWAFADFYNDDYTATFGAAPFNTNFDKYTIHGTNSDLIRTVGMTAGKLLVAESDNLFVGFDSEGDLTKIKFQENRRGIDVMFDFQIGMQIMDVRNISYGYNPA